MEQPSPLMLKCSQTERKFRQKALPLTHRPRKASVISAQFIFKPGTYDDEFHKLDAEIEAFVATIPGFLGAEKWISFDGTTKNSMYYFETMDAMFELSRYDTHREAKGKYQNWYDGYQIVVSEIKKSYGDGAIETIAKA
jgi:heme-degrading monooxygenase HmoA